MDNLICYEIRDWERCYTVSQNRKNDPDKPLPWVAMRTKHDGKGYRRVMRQPDAMALLGAWMLIVEVAAKCPTHGVLSDSDGPLTAIDLADKTGGDEATFERALQVFSSKGIEWLTTTTLPERSQSIRTTGRDGTGHDGTERYETKHNETKNPTSAQGAAPLDRGSTDLDRSGSESGFDVSIVTEETLRSLDRLRAWFRHDLTRPDSIVDDSEEFWQNVQTAAAKAVTSPSVRDEIAVFKWLVKGRHWDFLNATYEDIAKAMKRKAQQQKCHDDEPISIAKAVAERLAMKSAVDQPR